jgi:hypothetical protein
MLMMMMIIIIIIIIIKHDYVVTDVRTVSESAVPVPHTICGSLC